MSEKLAYQALEKRNQELEKAESERKIAEAARRQLEQDYQTLFREMLDGFALNEVICDALGMPVDYRFIAVNPAFERMTGLQAVDIVGKTVLEVLPGTEPHWIENLGNVALTGEPAFFENYSQEFARHFKVTAFQPATNRFVCIFSDITERKQAEKERNRLNASLAAKNDELEQVVYVASHDLRSPLVNIDGYSRELGYAIEDLRRAFAGSPDAKMPKAALPILEQDIPEALRFIRTSASKMDTLLAGLLRLSRSGRAALTIEPLDMDELVARVIDASEFQIKEAGVKIEMTALPACKSDPVQVNQVFSNLLSNALKYLDPKRSGIIRVSGRTEGDRSVYCVADNGVGIAPAHFDKMFEIFHRLNPDQGEGEGLGLTIIKRIIERLEGTVRVESDPGSGSRFYVELPAG